MAVFALEGISPQLGANVWVADSARVIGNVILGEQASVWFNAVLRGDNEPISIGARTNIQDSCVLHTDPGVPLTIGADVSIGHMAMLHGSSIGEGSLIGMNATLLNRSVIGKHCLIGAKTLSPEGKVIPDRSLVVGTPGRIIRELTDEEVARLAASTAAYIRQAARYRTGLLQIG